jgi:hypothetical protein
MALGIPIPRAIASEVLSPAEVVAGKCVGLRVLSVEESIVVVARLVLVAVGEWKR